MAASKRKFSFRRFVLRQAIFWVALLAVVWFGASAALSTGAVKKRIEAEASSYLQQPVSIGGAITLGMTAFRPALAAHDVTIGEAGKSSVLHAAKLEVAIPLTAVRDNSGPFIVSISDFRADNREYGDYRAPVRFLKDGFELTDIKGKLDGGTLEGTLSYGGRKLRLNIAVRNLDYSRIAEGIKGGKVQADIKLDGAGEDYLKLAGSLHGDISLVGGEGEMEGGRTLDFWAGNMLSAVLSGPDKETRVNCAVADFNVLNGVAHSKTVIIDTAHVTISGRGVVDLAQSRVDMRFTPRPKSPSLVNLATPVVVSGPFGNITAQPDSTGVIQKVGGIFLGTVMGPAALVPLIGSLGSGDKNPCAKFLKGGAP